MAPTKVSHAHPTTLVLLYPGQCSVFTVFLEHGDEVILFEPFFDQYLPSVTFNPGVPFYVLLHLHTAGVDKPTGHGWKVDFNKLRSTSRLRVWTLNRRTHLRRATIPKTKMDRAEHSIQPC